VNNYNPYGLVPLLINGKAIDGRPYEFDSDVVNQKTMKNAFGEFVKPSKVVSVCPDCSQGLQIDVQLGEPPFTPVHYTCRFCRPAPLPLPDPFVNPTVSGRVPAFELDPMLRDPVKPLEIPDTVVSERFQMPQEALPLPSSEPQVAHTPQQPARTRAQKSNKKKAPQPVSEPVKPVPQPAPESAKPAPPPFDFTFTTSKPKPNVEPADGISEEEFDDSGMVEE
jgi:hypothetical protein